MQKECRKACNSYMNKTLFDPFMSGKMKNFFRYIKSVHIGITMVFLRYKKMELHTYSCDVHKAEVLNRHFASVFVDTDLNSPLS